MFKAYILDIAVPLEARFICLSFQPFPIKKGVIPVQTLNEYKVLTISIKQQCAGHYRLVSKLTKVNGNLSIAISGLSGSPYTNIIY